MVIAGNGTLLMKDKTGSIPTITGFLLHFWYTLKMKFVETKQTAAIDIPKNSLKRIHNLYDGSWPLLPTTNLSYTLKLLSDMYLNPWSVVVSQNFLVDWNKISLFFFIIAPWFSCNVFPRPNELWRGRQMTVICLKDLFNLTCSKWEHSSISKLIWWLILKYILILAGQEVHTFSSLTCLLLDTRVLWSRQDVGRWAGIYRRKQWIKLKSPWARRASRQQPVGTRIDRCW